MKQLPIKLKTIMALLSEAKKEADKLPRFLVLGAGGADLGAITGLIGPAKLLDLSGGTTAPLNEKELLEQDAVIAVVRAGTPVPEETAAAVRMLREVRMPFALVVDQIEELEGVEAFLRDAHVLMRVPMDKAVFISSKAGVGESDLYVRLTELVPDRLPGLVAGCPKARDAAVDRLIKRTAKQNAVVGAVAILPGSDIQAITANQIKMVLMMAMMYGLEPDKRRAKELVAVLGSGLLMRAAARQVFDLVPGLGWAIKGTIAHVGTVALGKAARTYFEKDLAGK